VRRLRPNYLSDWTFSTLTASSGKHHIRTFGWNLSMEEIRHEARPNYCRLEDVARLARIQSLSGGRNSDKHIERAVAAYVASRLGSGADPDCGSGPRSCTDADGQDRGGSSAGSAEAGGGVGGLGPRRTRRMTSHVMLSNGAAYVIQYALTGIPFSALRSIFITHHHADHNIEYGPLLVVGWVNGMHLDVRAFGPPPLKQMTEDFMRAYKTTVDFWAEDFKMKPLVAVDVKEVPAAGAVTQDDNVKVSAIIVEHPPVKPALGYRFDFKDHSVAFSGDTAPFEAVAKMAMGADVLVHEAMYVPALESYTRDEIAKGRPVKFEDVMAHMKADHTPVEDVGRIAQEAGVKTLVLSHLVPATDGITDDTWRAAAAKYFKGEFIVGKDLMVV
jgi:ribonuclease BN (tRNA processing enzyme)